MIKEHLISEALSSCNTLVLEKKWNTQDPTQVGFTSFVSKESALVSKLEKLNNNNSENQNKKSKTNDECKPSHNDSKSIAPKEGKSKSKQVNDKMHCYCNKPPRREGKTMWALHK